MKNDYWMISDDSGQKFPKSEMRRTWRGTWVHYTEYEPRQPQDFIRGRPDRLHRGPYRIGVGDNAD